MIIIVLLSIACTALATRLWWEYVPRLRYPFLSPGIFATNQNDILINFTPLRSQIRTLVGGQSLHIGVYFEYLPSGVSIGVHEKDQFISASLLKVPFIMGVFKLFERGELEPEHMLTLEQGDLDPDFGTLWKKGVGTQLTVNEAVRLTITESDNTAALALDAIVTDDLVREVYDALDIPISFDKNIPVVSPKNYSSVLRCLYLSCFLEKGNSEALLTLLTQSIFSDGLSAGVPPSIPVAHKVGLYDLPNSDTKVRSDCGIVYATKRPYILCIFAEIQKGQESIFTAFTRQLSSTVYDFVSTAER